MTRTLPSRTAASRTAIAAGTIAASLTATLTVSAATAAAASTEAAVGCGDVVTTNVTLTGDLLDCTGPALVIGASGITIDLGGHLLDGVGHAAGIDGNGKHQRVTITNGTIREFGRGIELLENHGSRLSSLVLESNGIGVASGRTNRLTVDDVTARDNSFAGMELTFGDDARVRHSTVTGSGFGGIIDRYSSGSRYEDNELAGNEFFGLTMSNATGAVLSGNAVHDNTFDGVQLGFRTVGVRVERNVVSHNGGDGIVIDEPGNVVARNTVTGNGGIGISAPDGTIDRGGNVASGNDSDDCVGVSCG